MGRVSKRGNLLRKTEGTITEGNVEKQRYKAGIYARLSSNQDEKKKESIEVQIEIARKFVEEFNRSENGEVLEVIGCYTDVGKTGSNFERGGFQRLLQDIRIGKINSVIVKDLSRLGRNYLETGNYLEKIFPFLGVRFIAVADDFDTGKEGNENKQMASEIKNLVNDMYARDFSQKAKLHLRQRREEGSYVGGPPPYGYRAEQNGKRRILKKTKEVYHIPGAGKYKGWNKSAVERILKSETYTGTLVQGKTSITARDEKNRIHKPEDDWVITKDAHEPLVDRELYQKSVEIREKMKECKASYNHPTKGYPIGENIFDGVLYCGVCGRKMTRSSYVKHYADGEKARLDGYFCLNSGQTKIKVCPDSNRISKNELVDILLPLIRMEFAVFLNKPKHYMEYGKERIAEAVKKAEARLRETEAKLRRSQEEESCVYMDYRVGKIPQKEYVAFKMSQVDILEDLRKQQESQKQEIRALDKLSGKYMAAIKALLKLKSGKELTKDMIEAFISKIYVYPGKRIEVIFTFTADCMEGVK